ncbi:MAG: long-chain fatty acid--CoA ligase [Promethearchaeota archaeon]|nr:MAG: long-chain fatty acid--CoA ligase [Candidatus Lokiarchaeota archaeon]
MSDEKNLSYSDKPWVKSYKLGPFNLAQTMAPYPEISVYQFLEDAARDYPESIAIKFLDEEINYKELKDKADRLASALSDLGVKKGSLVATIIPNSPQFVISDFAILRLGAVHVPLSILHKAPDLLYELGESKAETVICSYRRIERIMEIKDKTNVERIIYSPVPIFPDYELPEIEETHGALSFEKLIETHEPNPPDVHINPKENLAELPFTGGTTGLPKGTMQTHYSITTNIIQVFKWYMKPLEAATKGKAGVVICVPVFHQYGHWITFAAVSMGMKMFLVDPRDIKRIIEIIKKFRPFMVCAVPTHYMLFLKQEGFPRMPTFYYSAAAALPAEVAEQFEKKTGVPMGEGYGMTEAAVTHINLTALSKVTGFMANVKRSIGIPVPDTDVKIVDPDTDEEVPFGEAGEILIRGPQIMSGYWPTSGKGLTNDGWLRTGDIGKMDEDGFFHIVDRIKDMINVSGMKVYSRVFEDILYEHSAVNEAAIIGIPDPERPGSERVKAFVQLKPSQQDKVTEEELIEYCKEKFPAYAVPKSIEIRKSLPLTLAMKIFKRKLKDEELAKMKAEGMIK